MKRQPKTAPHWCCIRPRKSFNKQGNSKKSPYTHRIPKISEKVNSQWMRPKKKNRSKPHTFALCSKCLIKKNKNIFIYLCISSIEIYLSIPSAFCQCGNPTKRAPMALKKNCGRPTRGYLFSRPEKNHSCTHTHTHATPPPFTAYHAISLPRSREQQRKKIYK